MRRSTLIRCPEKRLVAIYEQGDIHILKSILVNQYYRFDALGSLAV